jgi:hypothetical protein
MLRFLLLSCPAKVGIQYAAASPMNY